jgi:hypothetical protein
MDLQTARHKRWGYDRALIKTLPTAAKWIDDLGFALLFEHKGQPIPALWPRAVTPTPEQKFDWGPEAEYVWGWKDELPLKGLAWYGYFINGRKSFLAPRMLNLLYPRKGTADDYKRTELSQDAQRIADVLLPSGPQSAAALREATGLRGSAYDKAVKELGRKLVVTHYGIEDQGAGWPSAVLELTARAFEVKPKRDDDAATAIFLETILSGMPNHLARAYGWKSTDAKRLLERAVKDGRAEKSGSVYSLRSL